MDRFNRLQLAIHLGETEIATHDIQRNGVDVRNKIKFCTCSAPFYSTVAPSKGALHTVYLIQGCPCQYFRSEILQTNNIWCL